MKTVRMLRDFDYVPTRKWLLALQAGYVLGRVPEAAVKAIVAAGAGELVDAPGEVNWPMPKRWGRRCPPAG
jgi:hypothetical protein